MAELAVIGALMGIGYVLNKDGVNREQLRNIDLNVSRYDKPNGDNIYNSTESLKIRKDEQRRANEFYKKENIVFPGPPSNPNELLNKTDYSDNKLPIEFNGANNGINAGYSDTTDNFCGYSLTGDYINPNTFKHNNMVPFFGGSVKQNVDEFATKTILENFTGSWSDYKSKTAVPNMFEPEKDVGLVYGNNQFQDINTTDKDRYYVSNKRNNEVPIEKIYVGPGLNQGYTADPSGGFQQPNARNYAIPKRTNELRTKNNPKLTYEGRVLPGVGIARTGKVGTLNKNRPDTYYKNDPNRYFTSVGAFTKDRYRSNIRINNNNRNVNSHNKHLGPAGPAVNKQVKVRSKHKLPSKQQLSNYGIRNSGTNAWNINNKSKLHDYGKANLRLKRTIKESHITKGNRIGNVESSHSKKFALPFNPVKVKKTRKQNLIGNPNTLGYLKAQEHGQSYTYDPNDVAKTTIKETTIHNNNNGYVNPQGSGQSYTYDPSDIARKTVRQTTIRDNNTNGFMHAQEHGQSYTYDPNDIAKTTTKEQTIHNDHLGNVENSGLTKSIVYDPNDVLPTTNKEVSMAENVLGNINSQMSGDGYKNVSIQVDPTIRQHTSREQTNNANKASNGGYMITNKQTNMQPTLKDTVSNIEYTGAAGNGGEVQPMSYEDIYNSTISSLREGVSIGRTPTQVGAKKLVDSTSVNMNTSRTSSVNNQQLQKRGGTYGHTNNTTPSSGLLGEILLNNNKTIDYAQDRDNDVFTDQLQSNPFVQNINNNIFQYNK
jgi:hypothetical protein